MVDIRKIIIIFVIAILFSVLVFSVIDAIDPNPNYVDFCKQDMYFAKPLVDNSCKDLFVNDSERNGCANLGGFIEFFDYNSSGCPVSFRCNTCQSEYEFARKNHDMFVFYVSAVLSLIAIFIGLYLPASKNELNEWVGTGFMLGGAFALIFGTVSGFGSLDRLVRVAVIFLELILVLFIAYKKIGSLSVSSKKRKR